MLEEQALIKPIRPLGTTIRWYRPKLHKDVLAELNRKSDLKGLLQTVGFLALIGLTGTVFVWTCLHRPWLAVPALLVHGACCAFLTNGFHELVHESVFKTRWLNRFFLYVYSFLGWFSYVGFWASHSEHHRFTLHPPDDLEVVLPQQVTVKQILKFGIIDFRGLRTIIPATFRCARGRLNGTEWDTYLFTKRKPEMRPELHRWAAIVLIGHAAIAVASIATGYWPIVVAVSFGRYFGGALQFLCNATQHIGLVDEYPDFRICCRTITLNPILRFLYWHMNYHTEHHMFAGVPCYNLGRLHKIIQDEMPEPTHGLIATWKQIGAILRRQKADPQYQFVPIVPKRSEASLLATSEPC